MSGAAVSGLVQDPLRPPPPFPVGETERCGEAACRGEAARWGEAAPSHSPSAPPSAVPSGLRLLVLGLGNDILTDDAIGLRIVRALREPLAGVEFIDTLETEEMGLSLLDHIVGYDELVIVDAIQTGTAPPGHLHRFDGRELPSRRTGAPHFLGVGDTLALGRLLDLPMPGQVTILAIEVADPLTLGTDVTPALAQAFPGLVKRVSDEVCAISRGLRRAQEQTAPRA